ncbi:hypothetical protein LB521_26855 [Mesorhizobium sp. BR-1-1-8]|uniref:hypothetical protein n=1 Tax=Mesorhizobium sp. BR-1-1-8 TaxID=2876659 RepID=UPI001CCA3523|nr:hypothetical protein [Mesorhizobium sp. BR-1-1-8]MBZ9984755.1 hypothetical protein [Mesorhizobium sp. BR-1-1-8]
MMETALSKALEYLKTAAWQTTTIAIATALFLYLSRTGSLPALDPLPSLVAWVLLFLSAALSVAAIGQSAQRGVEALWKLFLKRRARLKAEQSFRAYEPFLSETERQILGYLLNYKLKTFVGDQDGGYAGTLIARGTIRYVGVPGQSFDLDKCPLAVPDFVWKVMEEMPEKFPHTPVFSEGRPKVEVEPWRIPWQLR